MNWVHFAASPIGGIDFTLDISGTYFYFAFPFLKAAVSMFYMIGEFKMRY